MTRHSTSKPNVVLIFPDQLRPDFLGCYGGTAVATPNIDALAASGTRYEEAFSASPICVPARVALLTGMNALKNGVLDNSSFLRPDHELAGIRTWPQLLAERGYYTAAVGKMHFYPWDHHAGFQYRRIAEDKVWPDIRDDYDSLLRQHGRHKLPGGQLPRLASSPLTTVNPFPRHLTVDGFVGDEACRFIDLHGDDGPFALMVGFPSPHDPYDPRPETLSRVDDSQLPAAIPGSADIARLRTTKRSRYAQQAEWGAVDYSCLNDEAIRVVRRHYAALVGQIDDEVGRIIAALSNRGLLDNTVVILASDHGDHLGDHGLGIGKNTFFDSAIRIPLIVRHPNGEHGQTCSEVVELRDIMASLLRLARCDIPAHVDAIPLPGLTYFGDGATGPGSTAVAARSQVVGLTLDFIGIYDGRWKMHKYHTGETLLFDTHSDPLEQHNVGHHHAHVDTLAELDAALTKELLDSARIAFYDRKAYAAVADVITDKSHFGREGWQRPFPNPLTSRANDELGGWRADA